MFADMQHHKEQQEINAMLKQKLFFRSSLILSFSEFGDLSPGIALYLFRFKASCFPPRFRSRLQGYDAFIGM